MSAVFVDLDVRPILKSGGEPFQKIMETVALLAPGQGLRLLAPFKPVPLFGVLGSKGFSHEERGWLSPHHHDHHDAGLSGDELPEAGCG